MQTRETKEITTPISGQKVVIHPWLTGGERRQLANELLKHGVEIGTDGKPKNVTVASNDAMDFLAWGIVIVSIDGKTEDVPKSLQDMRDEDYSFVSAEVNTVLRGTAGEKKTT